MTTSMSHNARFYIYASMLLASFLIALFKIRELTSALRYVALLLGATVISEGIAYYLGLVHRNNMPVYHFYTPVSLLLSIGFYSNVINKFKRYKLNMVLPVVGVVAAICNSLYLQSIRTLNSHFILLTGACVIGLSLWSFHQFYKDTRLVNLLGYPYFQVSLVFLFYWSSTFISWALHAVFEESQLWGIYIFIWIVNLITYSGLASIFLFYKKEKIECCPINT